MGAPKKDKSQSSATTKTNVASRPPLRPGEMQQSQVYFFKNKYENY